MANTRAGGQVLIPGSIAQVVLEKWSHYLSYDILNNLSTHIVADMARTLLDDGDLIAAV